MLTELVPESLSHQLAGCVALAGLDADGIDTSVIGAQWQHHFLSAFQRRVMPLVHHPTLYVVDVDVGLRLVVVEQDTPFALLFLQADGLRGTVQRLDMGALLQFQHLLQSAVGIKLTIAPVT